MTLSWDLQLHVWRLLLLIARMVSSRLFLFTFECAELLILIASENFVRRRVLKGLLKVFRLVLWNLGTFWRFFILRILKFVIIG